MTKFYTMKILLFFLLVPILGYSQSVKGDTLILADGSRYMKGELVTLSQGSKPDGGYAYISTEPIKNGKKVVGMPVQLTSGWKGYKMKIIDFSEVGNDIMGRQWYLVLAIDEKQKIKYVCNPALAKEAKEIL
jgi:hypothetical protein